jgi:DNA-binding MarR family transcriptional regulator
MIATLKRLALAALGALGVAATVAKLRRGKTPPQATRLLKHLATHTSASVSELSSRIKLSVTETVRLLDGLEERGLVQLSGDQGSSHVRIAAITKAGREQVA